MAYHSTHRGELMLSYPIHMVRNVSTLITHDVANSVQIGDVIFMRVLGQPMLILGSSEAAIDLLERRSQIYSSRMPANMFSL